MSWPRRPGAPTSDASRWCWLAALLTVAGCQAPSAFECSSAAACDQAVGGRCERAGVCSYPALDCPGGRRYSDSAGALAGTCVGETRCDPDDDTLTATERELRDLAGDRWLPLPDSEFGAYCVDHGLAEPGFGTGRCRNLIEDNASAAYDPAGRQLLLWGAEHYAGNEVYGFDLATGRWRQVIAPTPLAGVRANQEANADGTPNGRSSYGNLSFATEPGRLISAGASLFDGNAGAVGTWSLDPAAGTWTRGADIPADLNTSFLYYATSAFDEVRGRVMVRSPYRLAAYTVATDRWDILADLTVPPFSADSRHRSAIVVPGRRLLFVLGGTRMDNGLPDVLVWHLDDDRPVTRDWLPGTGDLSALAGEGMGAGYDSAADALVVWDGGAPAIYDLATKVWTRGSEVSSPVSTRSIYGRFVYVPYLNLFVLINSASERVYVYKHTAGCGPR